MLYSIVAVLVLVMDQAVKYWTVRNIAPQAIGKECVELIPGVLHMTNVENYGAAFSILENARWFLVAISVLFIVGIIVLISMEIIHTKFGRWTAVLVMAGALGNCIDRVLYGYVVDMFEIELFTFAVFNVADIFITVCGILFCIHVILYREPEAAKAAVPGRTAGRRTKAALPADEELEPEQEQEPRRGGRRTRARQPKEDPYANIPRRGQHRSLEEELRLKDPDDPFAEWDDEAPARPARRTRAAAEEPEQEPIRGRRTRPSQAASMDMEPDEQPRSRRTRPTVREDEEDMPSFEPAPARRQSPARRAAPAPEPKSQPDVDFEEFSLEDILSEFRED